MTMTVNLGLNDRMEALQQSVVAFQVAKNPDNGAKKFLYSEREDIELQAGEKPARHHPRT